MRTGMRLDAATHAVKQVDTLDDMNALLCSVGSQVDKLNRQKDGLILLLVEALELAQNLEGAATYAARPGTAYEGLDVPYHFEAIRNAIAAAKNHGIVGR